MGPVGKAAFDMSYNLFDLLVLQAMLLFLLCIHRIHIFVLKCRYNIRI